MSIEVMPRYARTLALAFSLVSCTEPADEGSGGADPSGSGGGEVSGGASGGTSASDAGDSGEPSSTGMASIDASDSGDAGPTGDGDGDSDADSGDSSDGGAADCDPRPGTNYVQREYESEDPDELFVEEVAMASYVVGGGWDGSNCWQVNPVGTEGNEDHAGWITSMLPPLGEGGTQTMFIGHLLYVSSGMIDAMVELGVGGKMLDAYMHDLPDGYGPTRQTVLWSYWNPEHPGPDYPDTAATGVVPRMLKGGAGGNYVRQVGDVPFDLRDYADQWIWLEVEFNAIDRRTALWIKTQDGVFTGAHCEPLMWRNADDPEEWMYEYDWVEEPYEYAPDEGWTTPGLAWGYWDDLEGKPLDADDFVRIDHLVVSDGWIPPPF